MRTSLKGLLAGENPSRAGWGAAILLSPHLVLGTWLLVVPDHIAFLTTQVVTLLHVAIAVLSVPFVALWVVRHALKMGAPRERRTRWAAVVRWVLAGGALIAAVTGGIVIWAGDIHDAHKLHGWTVVAVGVPLCLHLWNGRHRVAGSAIVGLMLLATAGARIARKALPPQPLDAPDPGFAFTVRSADLYDTAESCAECHPNEYAEWSRSTHARTMQNPLVRERMQEESTALGFDLADFGHLAQGKQLPHAEDAVGSCEMCHAPTSFYSDDHEDVLAAKTGQSQAAVTCSFCHTVRAVYPGKDRGGPIPQGIKPTDYARVMPGLPYYVSAPESVRRYLGQGSKNRLARTIGNLLMRWRPTVHKHDQHSPVLDSSLACMPCHSNGAFDGLPEVTKKAFVDWETSHYNTGNPATTITCQDCHLAREFTGGKSQSHGQFVPWGPQRDHVISHHLLGGNANAAQLAKDPQLESLQHVLNTRVAKLELLDSKVSGGELHVELRVTPRLVGHGLPAMAAQNRYLWVEVSAIANGKEIARTPRPKRGDDVGGATPVLFRCVEPPRADCDTVLRPDTPREFTARLSLPWDAKPELLRAELFVSVDRLAIAETSMPYQPQPGAPSFPLPAPVASAAPVAAASPTPMASGVPLGGAATGEPTNKHDEVEACAFKPEVAKAVFDALSPLRPTDGCVLDGVSTEKLKMIVKWSKNGSALPGLEVTATSCANGPAQLGSNLAFKPVAEVSAVCPVAVSAMSMALQGLAIPEGGPRATAGDGTHDDTRARKFRSWLLAFGAFAAATLVLVKMRRRDA